jgi:acid phosphatase
MKKSLLGRYLVSIALASVAGFGCGSSSNTPKPTGSGGSGGGAAGTDGGAKAGSDGGGTEVGAAGAGGSMAGSDGGGTDATDGGGVDAAPTPLNTAIQNIVIIYAENRTFDNLFGHFGNGAHDLSEVTDATGKPTAAYVPQKDRDGTTVLPTLPKTWTGVTLAGNPNVVTEAQSDGLANAPFAIENAYVAKGGPTLGTADVTRDLTHRFFENQMELNGGKNDMFAAWLDAGGLTMGHFDQSQSKLYKLAQQYVLADNFFEGAFGGSFLNHQYLICACAPVASMDFVTTNMPAITALGTANAAGVPQLALDATNPASALTGKPVFVASTAIAPKDYFGAGDGYRAINTIQAPYQPSGNAPAAGATGNDLLLANPAAASTLPPQTQTTIGDQLTAATPPVDWAWYATSWTAAIADGTQDSTKARSIIYTPNTARGVPDFQPHHHPYNYQARFDPVAHADDRTAHLKDYSDMVTAITAGKLPPVAWYKPTGNVNQHPGYANIDDGDAHIADLVAKLQAGPQWAHMVIVITYDEYGGQWDHVPVPKGDLLGPGSRIPAIIISPYAKKGTVDHTQYDSASTIRLIEKRFGLAALPGITARDNALKAVAGGKAMGDLTAALNVN